MCNVLAKSGNQLPVPPHSKIRDCTQVLAGSLALSINNASMLGAQYSWRFRGDSFAVTFRDEILGVSARGSEAAVEGFYCASQCDGQFAISPRNGSR